MTATFNKEGDMGKIVLVYSEDNFKLGDDVTFLQDIGNGVISVRHRNRTVWILRDQAIPLPASQPQRSEESQEEMWREAWGEYCKDAKDANFDGFVRYLNQHYTLIKK